MTDHPHEPEAPASDRRSPGDGLGSPGADVVHLDTVRPRHPEPTNEAGVAVPAPDDDAADAAPADPAGAGESARVDQPGTADRGDWLAELADKAKDRAPIVPGWLRSRAEARATLKWVSAHYAYVAGYQATRTPKYAAKLGVRAPRGLLRLVGGFVRWTFDLEGVPVRLATVVRADPEAYLKLSRQRDARVRLRV